jgi:hypothetical protein
MTPLATCSTDSNIVLKRIHDQRFIICEFEFRSGDVYSIQHYVIRVFWWLAAYQWFSPVFPTNKTYRHDIAEILLDVLYLFGLHTLRENIILLKFILLPTVKKCSATNIMTPLATCSTDSNIVLKRIHVGDLRHISGFLRFSQPIKPTATI